MNPHTIPEWLNYSAVEYVASQESIATCDGSTITMVNTNILMIIGMSSMNLFMYIVSLISACSIPVNGEKAYKTCDFLGESPICRSKGGSLSLRHNYTAKVTTRRESHLQSSNLD